MKTSYNSFCKPESATLPWEEILADMNKAVLEVYVLAKAHAVRMCELDETTKEQVEMLEPLDQKSVSPMPVVRL